MTAPIAYGGPESARPFAFCWYDKDRIVRGPLAKRYTGWAAAEARTILEGQRSLAELADERWLPDSLARDVRNVWNLWSTDMSDRCVARSGGTSNEWGLSWRRV